MERAFASPLKDAKVEYPAGLLLLPNDLGHAIIEATTIALLLFWLVDRLLSGNDTKLSHLLFSSTVASMASLGGITDFLPCPLVRVRKQRLAARFFMSRTLMPKRDQARFDVNISGVHG